MAVETSAITTYGSLLGVGSVLGIFLRFLVGRIGKHIDDAEKLKQENASETIAAITKRTDDLFHANEALRKNLNDQIVWFSEECTSLRTQLSAERSHSRDQDKALEACEKRSDECERKADLQAAEIVTLGQKHEELRKEFADSEEARKALRALIAAKEIEWKKGGE